MTAFDNQYVLFVFVSICGALQMVASYRGLHGLKFFRNRYIAFMVGTIMLISSFTWFFLSEPRNLPDTAAGLDGNDQFGLFSLAAGCATIFTLLFSSLLNYNLGNKLDSFQPGLDALKETTYIRAILRTVKSIGKVW